MDKTLVILVVEDHGPLRDVLVAFLESFRNVAICPADTVSTSISLIHKIPRIDLLLCDVFLHEEIDGIDIANMAVIAHPDVAVVLLSADAPVDMERHSGTYSYLQKPFDRKQLSEHIDLAFLKLRARAP